MGVNRLYPCTYFHGNDSYYWEPDWSRRPFAAGTNFGSAVTFSK